ncbi:MAG: type II secretion system protein GspK [Planctomycetaceae bacterium]
MRRRHHFTHRWPHVSSVTRRRAAPVPHQTSRGGFVLIVVTIVIVLLSLAAYNYSGTMQVELEAAMMSGRDVEARMAAESGIEYAATRIMDYGYDDTINLYHDPASFNGYLIRDATSPRGRLRFSILVPDEANLTGGGTRFGVTNENSKFNINRLLEIDEYDTEEVGYVYEAMAQIPGMTDDIADAILDWLDTDSDRRPGGAESGDYEALPIPYSAKNGPMDSIDELLKVQGVTPLLFYGEDANRNGLLDPNEDDGDASSPLDNGDGILDLGWQTYLTATSRERNTDPDGVEKINLNQGQMTELFDALEPELGEEAAAFIVAFRLGGTDYAQQLPGDTQNVEGLISRANIDLTVVPQYTFTSIYDLIGGETNAVKMQSGTTQTFTSPWPEDANTILNEFPKLERILTVTDDAYIEGRININQARVEVMRAVPGMPAAVPDAILAARPAIDLTGASSNLLARRNTAAWILAENLVDLETLRLLGPYITTGGDVYRFQVVGHFDRGGPGVRLEAMIDATQAPPKVTFVRDLTSLGPGYHPSLLQSFQQ